MQQNEDEKLLIKRFSELSARAEKRFCTVYSEFLTLAEQDTLSRMRLPLPGILEGGFDGAERRLARFGDEEGDCPIVCVKISPISRKFADELTHRDFLGALIALGIRREVLGDIIVYENDGYLFCFNTISDFIVSSLEQVAKTRVKCELCETPPEGAVSVPPDTDINVASERLDALVSAVYRLSRSESAKLFTQKKVFVNGRLTENGDFTPPENAAVSVRGFGRFIYRGISRETRKGRLFVTVAVY